MELLYKKTRIVIKKVMKKILILFLMLATFFGSCQDTNILTLEEYDNIKINDVKLIDVKNTYGNEGKITTLFGNTTSKNVDPDGDFYQYNFNGLKISFSAIISDGTHEYPVLSRFEITISNNKITINDTAFTIGDNINVLGENIVFNTKRNGSKSIVFSPMEGWNNFITIDFDQETKLITAIYYIELT